MGVRARLLTFLFSTRLRTIRRGLNEWKRRLTRRPHLVSVFLELDDPYSYLLAKYLPSLAGHYDIELRLYLTQALGDGYRPQADMLARYAEDDCKRLALELGVPLLDKGRAPPVEHRKALTNALAGDPASREFHAELLQAIELYWRGDSEGIGRRVRNTDRAGDGAKIRCQPSTVTRKARAL